MSKHPGLGFIGGDDWEISATLLDEHGDPYDLTSAEILWTLYNGVGHRVLDTGDYAVSIIDAAAGQCAIMVASDKTTTVPSGQYLDALRIVTGGVTSTLSTGLVYVTADPWAAVPLSSSLKLVA